ncbi:AAA family ATPase [Curtobacterium sp. PhB146]|uniref:ATP-dependent nuclease n=1 Tax=Curtobacterium sp. PhB146 TaxID=2485187 RepID=UPI00104CEA48|nr:AAA family ATPase [Curtobacterium sp. PhB146]TCU46844.1 putative ATP-dependent endonuclease of OLD family [Curtobacterium sp. PhB146]
MKLVRLDVKSFRSFVEGIETPLVSGMNAFVGPNNCGKSNLIRALKMALDENWEFDADRDVPGQRLFAYPRTTLTFKVAGKTGPEKTLLRYLKEYEESVLGDGKSTYSDMGELRLVVTYRGNRNTGLARQEYFAARGAGDRRGDAELNEKALRQFRKLVRFVSVESGQSIETLLVGQFQQILHSVLREELGQAYGESEQARASYKDYLQNGLLAPMREKILALSKRLFPEMNDVSLVPSVNSLEESLSDIRIRLFDSVETDLAAKGTGVAGGVLIALLRYLSDATKQSIVFALEEPEAFLHPAAQQALRDDLEGLAEREDVTLLVTTHSPYIISRSGSAQVVGLNKSLDDGISRLTGSALGNDNHAAVLSGLFVDAVLPEMLDRYHSVPTAAEILLVVEGETDKQFIELAARALDREVDINGVEIVACTGAHSAVAQAVLLKAEARQELIALFDSDQEGRAARDLMRHRFKFDKKKVLEYSKYANNLQDAESEWLFPAAMMQRFVDELGEDLVLKSKTKLGGEYRYDFTPHGKEQFPVWLAANAKAEDFGRWSALLDDLKNYLEQARSASATSSTES